MAGSPLAPSQRCHVRSNSLPSRPHPVKLTVEEELQKIRNYIDTASATPDTLKDSLGKLSTTYESIEELLTLPSNQACFLSSSQKRWLEVELNESVRLLDFCYSLKESLNMKKEHIKNLQLALRRRDRSSIESKAIAFICASKKINKDIKNYSSSLSLPDKCTDTHGNLETMGSFLIEVKSITISLLNLVSSYTSTQAGRQKSSRWLVISKALSKRKVACQWKHEGSGFRRLDFSSFESILQKDVDEISVQKLQDQLQSMEICMEGFENGLESLFRQMIHSRVALLNILSS